MGRGVEWIIETEGNERERERERERTRCVRGVEAVHEHVERGERTEQRKERKRGRARTRKPCFFLNIQ